MSEDLSQDVIKESRERGERLRRIRNLTNLSRKELCDSSDININTYIGYEVGRYGGLTKKGAKKIIDYVATQGVYTTFNWLMYGLGQAPNVVTEIKQNRSYYYQGDSAYKESEKQNITAEIILFRKHYINSIDYQIIDDGMSPIYSIGEYVAGVCSTGNSIKELIGFDCIMQIKGGDILVRNLREGRRKYTYTLSCINPGTSVNQPILYDVELIFAAKIIWHRKVHNTEGINKEMNGDNDS